MEEKFTFKSLRELRWDQGKLSQIDLARLSGVSRAHINKIERGHLHLSGFTAPRIASVFKVNYKSLIMAQELANNGLSEPERKEVITIALKEAEDLSPATIGVMKTIRDFDYGDRDSFGRKISKKEIEAKKRAEKDKDLEIDEFDRDGFGRRIPESEADLRRKEAKKGGALDFGSRDSFGRKIVKGAEADKDTEVDEDTTVKEFFDKDESTYEERLRALLLKGKKRKGLE